MENLSFLFAAYAVVWVFIFVYVVLLSRRNRALRAEIDELRSLIDHRQGTSSR